MVGSEHRHVCADKSRLRKVSARQIHGIKRAAATIASQCSKQIFKAAGDNSLSHAEYLCGIGCYGHKRRETHGVATILLLPLNPIEKPWSILKQRSMKVGGS